ncbi:putative mpr-like gpcr protein [Phaeoacremonium minimum UCRPA7]|uniref:Putative mpr-like gpcr protein n=1 Tax=Phaeoacremonium minimum (strain UCR-PA7) TaxID=1286976 RepID=R8BNS5_PHAM7|nr:putative mpr-like gpcr protein [Phaeoacremonium minimum UCRPA7]EOO00930.1 putative mpr-like gpcr protein [Phaeoacremonium minimum UCRPA7]
MSRNSGPPSEGVRQRPRRNSAAETLIDTAKQVEASVEKALLWAWDELPNWRRDNAFILRGYRPTSNSYWGSFTSLGYLHNESVNIWSHLLGAAGFTIAGSFLHGVVAPRYESASESDIIVFACFFAGAFCCLGMSATYHAICNHSPDVAKWGNKLDYSGIVFLILGSFVPALYYGFFCSPRLLTLYLSMICLLGLGCLTVSWFEHFRVVPVFHGLKMRGFQNLDEQMGLRWVLLQGALYIFGAFLYAVSYLFVKETC